MTTNTHTVHRAGERARYDSFAGFIPCVVEAVDSIDGEITDVTFRVTRTTGPYRIGETVTDRPSRVVPVGHVRTRNGRSVISTGYRWVESRWPS